MILGWTPLRPSRRERRLRLAALALTLAVSCALTIAALTADPRHPGRLWAAILACAGMATAIAWRPWRPRQARHIEVAIDARGSALLRATPVVADGAVDGVADAAAADPAASESLHARCVFAAPWLITLRRGALHAPIWPDSMPADAFRRLHACMRWATRAQDSRRAATPDPS